MGVLIPIFAVFFAGMLALARTPIGRAMADRIAGGAGADDDTVARVAQLEQEMEQVKGQLVETQERMDFAERMLTQVREAQRLPPAPPAPPTRVT